MKNILYPIVVMTLFLLGTQGIAGKAPTQEPITAAFKTKDGSIFRCDVHRSDAKNFSKVKNGEAVEMCNHLGRMGCGGFGPIGSSQH